jgi:hypothetical protein
LITARRWSAGLLVVGLLVGGCSANLSPAPAVSAAAATAFAPSPAATPSVAAPSASPVASAGSSPSASGSAGPAIPIDPLLLAILPVTVGGQPISEMPDIEANLMTDPDLQTNAASLAVALGINSATGDFAYVAIIQLKPLVFSDAWYASWRQSYDEGACSQSSGRVFVGHCAGGALTYHVHLTGPDRVVSITSVGSAGFGALVVGALKP